ncbi:MAG: ATP-binding cassette domain-containing protein [Dehalococcoidia bacterium]|nr:ATP-binding cassette domain-containing protein [Dehalococcoidia bacterium]
MATAVTQPETAGPAADPMVEVRDVSRTFHIGGSAVHAVRDVDLEVPHGQFLAIVGRSGSGKTTLLNIIAGLDKPDSGSVFIEGQETSRFGDQGMTELRRHTLGFVFQSFGLLPLLSAEENVELALRIAGAGLRERGERTRELLEQVGLSHRADHRPYELSGGEQQRVAVARALANKPRLLIADEPTGELDSATGAQIFALLHDVAREGVTVITATHDPFVIEHVDRVREMSDGALLPEGEGATAAGRRLSEQATEQPAGPATPALPRPAPPRRPPYAR